MHDWTMSLSYLLVDQGGGQPRVTVRKLAEVTSMWLKVTNACLFRKVIKAGSCG